MKASVIVRSYNRLEALCELLGLLLDQEYNSYEIVVVEQSTEYENKVWDELLSISKNPKIKLLTYEPLGGPKARNEGVKNSSGEILIFIDDDDLPSSNQWISQHVEVYEDKKLIGFTGRHVFEGNTQCPYVPWMRWFIRKKVMNYNWLKFPYTFAQFDEDVHNVKWLHGTNSSIRKEWVLKAGLWDTDVKNQDEHSFAFKLQPHLKNGYRLDFKKDPALIRRMDIGGGMGKREFSMLEEWKHNYAFYEKIILNYFPFNRFLYPIYLVYCFLRVTKHLSFKFRGN